MKAEELRGKNIAELEKELLALRREQFNLRMQQGGGQSPRPDQFAKARKTIARIRTVMAEKQRADVK